MRALVIFLPAMLPLQPLAAAPYELGASVRANIAAMAVPPRRDSGVSAPVSNGVRAVDAITRYETGHVKNPSSLPADNAAGAAAGAGAAAPRPPSSSMAPR